MTLDEINTSIDSAISEAREQGFLGDDANEYANMELTGGAWHDELQALGADEDRVAALNALKDMMIERFDAQCEPGAADLASLDTDIIRAAWTSGNNNGDGYSVGCCDDDTCDCAIDEQAGALGLPLVEALSDHEMAVYSDGETMVAVCDSHGPWAVNIDVDGL